MKKRSKKNNALRRDITRWLLFLNAIFWLAYGVYIYHDMAVVNNNKTPAYIVTGFLLVMAALMFTGGIMLGRQPKRAFYPLLVLTALAILFALINLSNLLYLLDFVLDAIILALLLSLRNESPSPS